MPRRCAGISARRVHRQRVWHRVGLGVGHALVDECVRRARRAGAAELGLHTSESMRVARRMYERMGFERAPERDFRPGGAELVEGYRLRLDR